MVHLKESNVGYVKVKLINYEKNKVLISIDIYIYIGADINAPDAYGYTPLMNAAMLGRLKIVKALIELGADVQKKGQFGYTALHAAAQGGHLEVVQALVKYGASVNCKNDDGDIPLILGRLKMKTKIRIIVVVFFLSSCSWNSCRNYRLFTESWFGHTSKWLAWTISCSYS